MKNLLFVLLTFWCCWLHAQKLSPLAIEDEKIDAYLDGRKLPVLTIHVMNQPKGVSSIGIKYTLVQFAGSFQVTRYTKTDSHGVSKILLEKNVPYQQIWLTIGHYLYTGVYINTGLTITLDVKEVSQTGAYMIGHGVDYSGPDGEFNNVMNKHVLFKKQERENLFNELRALCGSRKNYNPKSFAVETDSILTLLKNLDIEFNNDYPGYNWAISNEIMSEFYGDVCVSYWADTMPDRVLTNLRTFKPLFTSNNGVLFYKCLSTYYYMQKLGARTDRLGSTLKLFDSIGNSQRSDILKLSIMDLEKESYNKSYPIIINSIKANWCKRIAIAESLQIRTNQRRIDSLFALSKPFKEKDIGKSLIRLPFGASLYKLDTATNIDNFIMSLKSKFRDKALIMDFWATWCVPCIYDLPYSKNLHEKNRDLPIEYIYLCTSSGSSLGLWKNKIVDLKIPGTHIYVDDKIMAKLKAALGAGGGFPAYVTIDVKGKINKQKIISMQVVDRDILKKVVGNY